MYAYVWVFISSNTPLILMTFYSYKSSIYRGFSVYALAVPLAPSIWCTYSMIWLQGKLRTARRLIWEIGYKLKDTLGTVGYCGSSCPNKKLKADLNGCVDTIKEVIVKYHSSYGVEDVEKSYYRQEVRIGFDLRLLKPRYMVCWLELWYYCLRLRHQISSLSDQRQTRFSICKTGTTWL